MTISEAVAWCRAVWPKFELRVSLRTDPSGVELWGTKENFSAVVFDVSRGQDLQWCDRFSGHGLTAEDALERMVEAGKVELAGRRDAATELCERAGCEPGPNDYRND